MIVLAAVVFNLSALAEEGPKDQGKKNGIEIKQNLRRIKSTEKKDAVAKISEELVNLNNRKLEQFENSLKQLERTLSKTMARAEKRAQKGFNIDNVKAAAEVARAAIAASRTAIEQQKGKTYKIEDTAEPGLKEAVKKVRAALHSDLKVVQDSVKQARKAVHDTATSLAKIRKNGRATPTTSPAGSASPAPSPSTTPTVTPTSTPTPSETPTPTPTATP